MTILVSERKCLKPNSPIYDTHMILQY